MCQFYDYYVDPNIPRLHVSMLFVVNEKEKKRKEIENWMKLNEYVYGGKETVTYLYLFLMICFGRQFCTFEKLKSTCK